jgi:hypothetical protein
VRRNYGGRRALAALAGLAACAVLTAGLLVFFGHRPPSAAGGSASAPSPANTALTAASLTIQRIDWHPGGSLFRASDVRIIVPSGGKLFAVGDLSEPGGTYRATVWSSTDGLTWNQTTRLDTFSNDPSIIFAAVPDGHGGLIAVVMSASGRRTIWHSPDGSTWTAADLGDTDAEPLQLATDGRTAVATGVGPGGSQTYAWSSTDGLDWTRTALPESEQVSPSLLLAGGYGGFEVLAPQGVTAKAWHSEDGRTWVQAQAPGAPDSVGAFNSFGPTALLASGGRFVALGHDGGGRVSAWTSADGQTWSSSVIDDPALAFGCENLCQIGQAAQVGSTLVAVGYRAQSSEPVVAWVSADDGRTWRLLGSGSPGVLPSAMAALDSEPVLIGQEPVTGTWRSARGSVVWQAVESPTPSGPTASLPTRSPIPTIAPGPITFHQATMPKLPASSEADVIAYANGRFYGIVNQYYDKWGHPGRPDGPLVWESDDGTSWRQIANQVQFNGKGAKPCASVYSLAEDGAGGLVAVGGMDSHCGWGAATSVPAVWRSEDGATWRRATVESSSPDQLTHVVLSGGHLVATGSDGAVLYSDDHGQSWHQATLAGTAAAGPLLPAPWQGGFVAVHQFGAEVGPNVAWQSADGHDWVALGKAPDAYNLLHVDDVLVSGGYSSLYWSPDGVQWTSPGAADDRWLIGSGGDVAMAVTFLGEIWLTADGKTWVDTASKFLHVDQDTVHQFLPMGVAFCIGAGRIVTIVQNDVETGAYYADLPH